jgi:hypothetical protein
MKTRSEKINLSGGQILAINKRAPEKLFSGDLESAKMEYYALSRVWHPDRNSDRQATVVFQHITELYRTARELIETSGNLRICLKTPKGKSPGFGLRATRCKKR